MSKHAMSVHSRVVLVLTVTSLNLYLIFDSIVYLYGYVYNIQGVENQLKYFDHSIVRLNEESVQSL